MKITTFLCSLFLMTYTLFSQEVRFGIHYDYLYCPAWDKAIQTYNFARPNLSEKQPLLINGLSLHIGYLKKSTTKIQQGFQITYKHFNSEAINENFTSKMNLHMTNISYLIHIEDKKIENHFFYEGMATIVSGGLFKKVNDTAFVLNDKNLKGLGIGIELNIKAGLLMEMNRKYLLSPFIGFSYAPFYYNPNSEAVLNQTKTLTGKPWNSIYSLQTGLIFRFKKN